MRFFAGGLNHAKTTAVHNMHARITGDCPACMTYITAKRLGLPIPTLPENGAPRY